MAAAVVVLERALTRRTLAAADNRANLKSDVAHRLLTGRGRRDGSVTGSRPLVAQVAQITAVAVAILILRLTSKQRPDAIVLRPEPTQLVGRASRCQLKSIVDARIGAMRMRR